MTDQDQPKVAMVIMAHPDDAEFGSAGTVATWVAEGWDVHYVVCTDGSGGGPDDTMDVGTAARQKVIATRKLEQRAACDILGVTDMVFLDYTDGQLQPSIELRRDLVRLLRQYRPTRVICPSPDRVWEQVLSIPRQHSDHLAAGQAALSAIYPASQNPWDFPELLQEGLKPHTVKDIYIVGAPIINYAVDISATIDRKMEALRAHTSQVAAHFDEINRMLRERSAEIGQEYGMPLAEVYHRIER